MTRARGPLHLWRKGFNPYTRTGWWLRNICYQKDVILANQKMASAKRLEKFGWWFQESQAPGEAASH